MSHPTTIPLWWYGFNPLEKCSYVSRFFKGFWKGKYQPQSLSKSFDIGGKILEWIKSFLTGKMQTVMGSVPFDLFQGFLKAVY